MEEANLPSNPIDMGNEDVKRRKKKKIIMEEIICEITPTILFVITDTFQHKPCLHELLS